MKTALKPQEYYYLDSPLFSDPTEMIKYTFRGLYVTGHILVYHKFIYINKRADRKRKRIFLSLGPNYNTEHSYSSSEKLIISLIEPRKESRLHLIVNGLKFELEKDPDNFKTKYLYEDLKRSGYCDLRIFVTQLGKKEREKCKDLIDTLDKNIDALLSDKPKLAELLLGLGSNIIFLNEETLSKIKIQIPELKSLDFTGLEVNSLDFYTFSLSSFDGLGAFNDFSFDSSIDFDGFDGGDFGGAGSGGDW